jgi:hypothetical protein
VESKRNYKKIKKSQDLHVSTEVGGMMMMMMIIIIIIIIIVVSQTLQSSVDLGLPHNPPPNLFHLVSSLANLGCSTS